MVERLEHEHRGLENRLAQLDKHLSLTHAEQAERTQLKKQKLVMKDRIRAAQLAATDQTNRVPILKTG